MLKLALATITVASLAAVPATAQVYGQLNAGVSVGSADVDASFSDGADSLSGSQEFDLETGWLVSAAMGSRMGAGLRLEGEITYATNDVQDTVLGEFDGEEITLGGVSVSQLAAFANAYYDFATDTPWTPYVGAGVGYGVTRLQYDEEDEADRGLAWQLKAGVAFTPSPNLTWDIGYRYQRYADFDVAYSEPGYSESLSVQTGTHSVTVGARFAFGS